MVGTFGNIPDQPRPDLHVSKVSGTLVTDSRSVYDKLQRPYISPTGQSEKVDIELVSLKNAQHETGLDIRWVNSEAMLAKSKRKERTHKSTDSLPADRPGGLWRITRCSVAKDRRRRKRICLGCAKRKPNSDPWRTIELLDSVLGQRPKRGGCTFPK